MSADRSKRRPFGDYEVGYGRPPEHSRFQPGQSGNPRGRPKASQVDLAGAIEKELAQKVTITENGQRRRVTKRAIIAKQVVNKAVGGDLGALRHLQAWEKLRALARNKVPVAEAVQRGDDDSSDIDWSSVPTEDMATILDALHIIDELGRSEPEFPVPPPRIPKREKN